MINRSVTDFKFLLMYTYRSCTCAERDYDNFNELVACFYAIEVYQNVQLIFSEFLADVSQRTLVIAFVLLNMEEGFVRNQLRK